MAGVVLAGLAAAMTDPVAASGTARQLGLLQASDAAAGDGFGAAVAISSSTVLVGAPDHYVDMDPYTGQDTGRAYVFGRSGHRWIQKDELAASNETAYDYFGTAVAISGSTAIIGAPGKNVDGVTDAGAVYVFSRTDHGWMQSAELSAAVGSREAKFGDAVALSGRTAVVGATGGDSDIGEVYIFSRTSSGWSETAEFESTNGLPDDQFGTSVAVSGSTVLVGDRNQNNYVGTVYQFTQTHGHWSSAELAPGPIAPGYAILNFGGSVALVGKNAMVGAPTSNTGVGQATAGIAFGFGRDKVGWQSSPPLAEPEPGGYDEFGSSVALTTSTALIGAPGRDTFSGAVYWFQTAGAGWSEAGMLTDPDGVLGEQFGASVAIHKHVAVVGAPTFSGPAGRVWIFSLTDS
jgi:hypothetical protein